MTRQERERRQEILDRDFVAGAFTTREYLVELINLRQQEKAEKEMAERAADIKELNRLKDIYETEGG